MDWTKLAIVARDVDVSSGFSGDFVETRLISVDCRHEGRRLIALKITVTEPWAEAAASRMLP